MRFRSALPSSAILKTGFVADAYSSIDFPASACFSLACRAGILFGGRESFLLPRTPLASLPAPWYGCALPRIPARKPSLLVPGCGRLTGGLGLLRVLAAVLGPWGRPFSRADMRRHPGDRHQDDHGGYDIQRPRIGLGNQQDERIGQVHPRRVAQVHPVHHVSIRRLSGPRPVADRNRRRIVVLEVTPANRVSVDLKVDGRAGPVVRSPRIKQGISSVDRKPIVRK